MKILDRIARAWLLRPGAEWKRNMCATCVYCSKSSWVNMVTGENSARCNLRNLPNQEYMDRACPAWRRKEEA